MTITPWLFEQSCRNAAVCLLFGFCADVALYGQNAVGVLSHDFSVTEEDGVELALTTGGPKFDVELFTYEKVLEIRPDPAVAESYLYNPGWMTIDDAGHIYVADPPDGRVVAFDAQGNYLRSYGGRGEGPGEFRLLNYIELVDDVLWLQDWNGLRSQLFDLDGTFRRTVRIPEAARRFAATPSLWWGAEENRMVLITSGRQRGEHARLRAEARVIGPDGRILAGIETQWVASAEYLQPADGGGPVELRRWFRPVPSAHFARGRGIYMTSGVEPVIDVYGLNGDLVRRIRIDLPPQPVADEDRAWALAQLEDDLRRAQGDSAIRTARIRRNNPRFVDPKGYWRRLEVDTWGFIWLSPVADRDELAGKRRMLVLSPEGEYLGQTLAPIGNPSRGHMLGTEEDPASGESLPVVYRIRPAVDGIEYR